MSNEHVSITIKVDDDGSFKKISLNADEMRSVIEQVKNENDKLKNSLINNNQAIQAFRELGDAVRGLQSVMHSLTDAYGVQAQAEARLEQMMRNTMGASNEEVQSIKDLAAEMEKMGVIGDEVILSGAQELATYMQRKDSLEALIPVMTDMIAQQYEYNATTSSAVSVAQMMGKVFAGEVGSLKRLGYTFDEAQEQILKFGTEEEKVAVLTEVVGGIVDGANKKLASTTYGTIVQFNNQLGTMKEQLGAIVAPAMNAVDSIANLTIAIAGISKGVTAIKAATVALKGLGSGAALAATRTAVLGLHSKVTATAQNMLAAAGIKAAAGTTALKIAVTGLYAALTLGLSFAIQGIITLITRLANANKDATRTAKELTAAEEAFQQAAGEARGAIIAEADELMMLMATNNDTTEAVAKLNEKYGEAFGYYDTAAQWYDVLKNKSEAYCRQLGYEAKAKQISAEVGNKITERDTKQEQLEALKRQLPDYYQLQTEAAQNAEPLVIDGIEVPVRTFVVDDVTPEQQAIAHQTRELAGEVAALEGEINGLLSELRDAQGKAAQAGNELNAVVNGNTQAVSWQAMGYADLGKAINDQKKKVEGLIGVDDALAAAEGATLQAMQKRYADLGNQLDKVTGNVKRLKDETEGVRETVEKIPSLAPIAATSVDPIKINENYYDRILKRLRDQLRKATLEEAVPINAEIARVEAERGKFLAARDGLAVPVVAEVDEVRMTGLETFTKGWGGLKGIGNSIRDIKSALTETDNAWDALTQTIDGFISMFQSVQQVVEIINTITAATQAMQGVRDAATQKELGNATAEVAANTAKAGSGAASSVASIPYVGPVLAIAAMASVIAALASLPKFANGGLVYGPTLGLMGEYGGASSNPEVIAPLSRLRSILGADQGGRSEVKFRIEGRELVGIMNKQTNIYQRNR